MIVVVTGCLEAPVERLNPLDSGARIEAQIVGLPDTIHSRGETHTFALVTSPALPPDTPILWRSSRFILDSGNLTSAYTSVRPIVGVVEAVIGNGIDPRIVRKSIVERQRPFRLALACESCPMPEFGMPVRVASAVFDSVGNVIENITQGDIAIDVQLRDSSLFRWSEPPFLTFTGGRNGQTWVIARVRERPTVADSALLRIWQVHRAVVPRCPVLRFPGDTGTIVVDRFLDRAAFRVEHDGAPPQIVWSTATRFGVTNMSATEEGFVTAMAPGSGLVVARFVPDSVDRGVPDQVRGECTWSISAPPS